MQKPLLLLLLLSGIAICYLKSTQPWLFKKQLQASVIPVDKANQSIAKRAKNTLVLPLQAVHKIMFR